MRPVLIYGAEMLKPDLVEEIKTDAWKGLKCECFGVSLKDKRNN